MKKRIIVLLGVLILMSLMMTSCYNLGKQVDLEERIKYSDNVESISIDSVAGDVYVIPEDRSDVYVKFETYENGQILRVWDGKNIRIKTDVVNRFFNFRGYQQYRLFVYIPESYENDLKIELTSGNVEMSNFDLADLVLDMTSGDMNISNVTANSIRMDMTSGDSTFTNVDCDLMKIDKTSGGIELNGFTGAINGESTSGEIDVHYKNEMNDFVYSITSGEVRIDYNGLDVDANFDIDATSGDIRVNLDLDQVIKLDDDIVIGSIGDGTYDVHIDMTSGDVNIFR